MTAKERDSRVAVVHGRFPERVDSILSAFSWEHMISQDVRTCTCDHCIKN